MRILLTCHRDPFHRSGGSETVVRTFARGLQDDHDVTVATALEGDLDREEEVEGVRVVRFRQQGLGDATIRAPGYRSFLKRDWDAAVVYGQGVWVSNQAVGLLGRVPARTVYFPVGFYNLERAHARSLPKRLWDAIYYRTVQRHLLESADVVAALTEDSEADIRALAEPRSLVRVPNGVHADEFRLPPDLDPRDRFGLPEEAPLVVNVGGDYPNKRLGLSVEAVAAAREAPGPDPVLCLCGPGTEDRSDPPAVRGLGFVSEEAKRALLHEAQALLLTSDFEGFGLVLLEALASGTPIVSTPVGAAPELARKGGGEVAEADPEALAAALRRVAEADLDPDRLQGLAREYDWNRILPTLERVLAGGEP